MASATISDLLNSPDPGLPPAAPKTEDAGFTFDQAVQGVHQYYRRMAQAEATYRSIRGVLTGQQDLPIVRWPTGMTDEEGLPVTVEVDLNQVFPARDYRSAEERLAAIHQSFRPLHNYMAKEFTLWMHKLATFAVQADAMLMKPAQPQPQLQPMQQPAMSMPPPPPTRATQQPGNPYPNNGLGLPEV